MPLDPIIAANLLKGYVYGGFTVNEAEAVLAVGDTIETTKGAFHYDLELDYVTLDSDYYPSALLPVSTWMYEIRDHTDATIASLYDATAELSYQRQPIHLRYPNLGGCDAVLGSGYSDHGAHDWRNVNLVGDYIIGYSVTLANLAIMKITTEKYPLTHTAPYACDTTDPGNNWGWRTAWNNAHSVLLVTRRDEDEDQSLYQYTVDNWDTGELTEIVITGESSTYVVSDDLGENMTTYGDWAVLAAPLDDNAGTDDGTVAVYKWDGVDRFEYLFFITPERTTSNAHAGRICLEVYDDGAGNVFVIFSSLRGTVCEIYRVDDDELGATLHRLIYGGAYEDMQGSGLDHDNGILYIKDEESSNLVVWQYNATEVEWFPTGYLDCQVGEFQDYLIARWAETVVAKRGYVAYSNASNKIQVKKLSTSTTPSKNACLDDQFTSDITGWTADNSATLANDTARLKITNGAAAKGIAKFAMTTVAGQNYLVKCNITTSDCNVKILADDTSTITGDLNTFTSSATGFQCMSFQATDTTTWLSFQNDSTTNGHISYIDDVEVVETLLDNAAFSDGASTPWTLGSSWSHDSTAQTAVKSNVSAGDLTYDMTGFTWTQGTMLQVEVYSPSPTSGGTSYLDVDMAPGNNYASYERVQQGTTIHHVCVEGDISILRFDCNATGAPTIGYVHVSVQTAPTYDDTLTWLYNDTECFSVTGADMVGDNYEGYYGGAGLAAVELRFVAMDDAGTHERLVVMPDVAASGAGWITHPFTEQATDLGVVTHAKYKAPTGGAQDYTAIRKA